MAIELKDITSKWMYISIKELKESGFWTKDFEDNPQTYSDEWITKAINLSSVKINDWTGGYIGYADNIDNLTEEQQIGVKWATAIYTLHWLSKGTEYLLQATTFSQGSQSYNIDVPQDMQFVPDEVQKILINAGLYENIRFANLKEKDKSWFGNGWRYEFDEGSGYASYDWVRNNYIANFNITSSDNSILINFINRIDAMPQKLDLKINPNLKFKIDNKSVVYNSNNELSVPFDNDSIYYDEINKVWKSNTGNIINPESIMKTLNPNDFVITEGGNNKGKISVTNGYNDELAIDDPTSGGEFVNYMRTRQIGIKLMPTQSGKANASFNQKTGELEIWDPAFKNNDITADFGIVKSTTKELKTTDDTLPTTKYINEHYQLKGSGSNDWEIVDTSDFTPNTSALYQIKNFDSSEYIYQVWATNDVNYILYIKSCKNIPVSTNVITQVNTGIYNMVLIFKNVGTLLNQIDSKHSKIKNLYIERKKVS